MRAVIVACEGCAKSKAEVAELRVELELEREGRRKAEAALESTRVELVKLEQLLFGPRSERGQSGQGVKESQGEAEAKSEAQERRGRGQQPGSAGHGRRSYEHLPTRHERHDPPVEGRRCEKCGKPYAVMPSEEQTEIIEMAVESRRVIHHRRRWRRTCGCRKSRAIVTAAAVPKVIPRGRFGEGLMARLLMWKFVWGLPVERMSDMLGQEGLALAPGTLCGLLRKMEPLLAPLTQLILARNAASDHLHADETRWRVLASEAGSKAWWLWVFGGPDTVAFVIKPSRGLTVVAEHLGIDLEQKGKLALPGGRQLVLSSDFYAVYASLGRRVEGIDNHYCWAHVRRHVRDVGRAHPSCAVWAEGWLRLIGQLYEHHRAWLSAAAGSEQEQVAEEQAVKVLEAMEQALGASDDATLPGPAYKVLLSISEQWSGLLLPYTDIVLGTKLSLDNNRSERHLRREVVGRKNYYGSGAEWSARLAASVWTIYATIELAGWNGLHYFEDYLRACAQAGGKAPPDLSRFLPWQASPADAARWRLDPGGGRSAPTVAVGTS